MDSRPQVLLVPSNDVPCGPSVRDRTPEVGQLVSGNTSSSPFFEDARGIYSFHPESADSEDGGCSMESDASSNCLSKDSLVADPVSLTALCMEKHVNSCPSGGSILTYDDIALKLCEGECERTGDRKFTRRIGSCSNALDDDTETSIKTGLGMSLSVGPAWTDDKHCSYLDSIEATFVQSLYGQEYCGVGQDDQDCVESRYSYPNHGTSPLSGELFTSLQRGCYYTREYYKPQILHKLAPTIRSSPWIQHFSPRITSNHGGTSQEPDSCLSPTVFVDGGCVSSPGKKDVEEEVMESCPELPGPTQGCPDWNGRFQGKHIVSSGASGRAGSSMQGKKRRCSLDSSGDDVFYPKKQKSAQRILAEIDLKMEELFVLKQKNLKEHAHTSDLTRSRLDGGCLGLDLKIEEDHEHVTCTGDLLHGMPQPPWRSTAKQPSRHRKKLGDRFQMDNEKMTNLVGSCELLRVAMAKFVSNSFFSKVGAEADGHCSTCLEPPQKLWIPEIRPSSQPDVAMGEDQEREVLSMTGPRTSNTYTWGSLGTRRRLYNERNVFVDCAGLSGSGNEVREDKLQSKEQLIV